MGVSLGTLGATLSRSESQLRSLQHVTVRAAQGKDATMNLGSRYPIINASFAPIFNTAAISQVIGNNSFIAPVPSFTYEDIGITLKVKPSVHGDTDVSMNIEIKVRSLDRRERQRRSGDRQPRIHRQHQREERSGGSGCR